MVSALSRSRDGSDDAYHKIENTSPSTTSAGFAVGQTKPNNNNRMPRQTYSSGINRLHGPWLTDTRTPLCYPTQHILGREYEVSNFGGVTKNRGPFRVAWNVRRMPPDPTRIDGDCKHAAVLLLHETVRGRNRQKKDETVNRQNWQQRRSRQSTKLSKTETAGTLNTKPVKRRNHKSLNPSKYRSLRQLLS